MGEIAWNSTVVNSAGTLIFLGGGTFSTEFLPGHPTTSLAVNGSALAASMSLSSYNYIWAKAFVDTTNY